MAETSLSLINCFWQFILFQIVSRKYSGLHRDENNLPRSIVSIGCKIPREPLIWSLHNTRDCTLRELSIGADEMRTKKVYTGYNRLRMDRCSEEPACASDTGSVSF